MAALFKKLRAIYLQRWDDQFRAESPDKQEALIKAAMVEWGEALAGMTGEQIKRGIDRSRVECEWPPSIAKFAALAKAPAGCWEHVGPAYRLHVRALPRPKASADVVRAQLAAMRGALHG